MRYTLEEMRQRRLAVEAEQAKKEERERKKAEKEARRQAREEKNKAFKNMVKASIGRPLEKSEFSPVQNNEIRKIVRKELEEKLFDPISKIKDVNSISANDKIYRKFTCEELIKIFGGWFTCTYLFSVQSETEKSPLSGKPIETDYWCCSQDVSGIRVNERPPVNEWIKRKFNKEVYGLCIIAPSTAF